MAAVNVVCIKWGISYDASYVNRLYSMVKRNLKGPVRFICMTDDAKDFHPNIEVKPLPEMVIPEQYQVSPWRKIGIFKRETLADVKGKTLFLDLDLIIIEDLDSFFEYGQEDDICIIENWTQMGRGIGNSSVFRFNPEKCHFIYDAYAKDPLTACETHPNGQTFFSKQVTGSGKALNYWPAEWCRSFKRHCISYWPLSWIFEPKIPARVKIIAFHGHPKPHEAALGKYPGKNMFYRFLPTRWIYEYWR
ncbi:MAG: hypothetical protein JSS50_01110 [Proteobacteria bacterium]|nr:hypothetical protein [Pseudomonadota bacterium]